MNSLMNKKAPIRDVIPTGANLCEYGTEDPGLMAWLPVTLIAKS